MTKNHKAFVALLFLIPLAIALWVWHSALSFVPVPWPDDSAFYFVAKEFFHWPPRWVMLPQAPFEPTYALFNFNTMPLYPILIGLGRLIGIDGSHALKLWPLTAWALSGGILCAWIYRAGLPFLAAALLALTFSLDPAMRWASVLIRPESFIGLCGIILILGLTLGFPKRWEPKKFWDPVSALLAIAAYTHFNAIHLVFPVILALLFKPRRLLSAGMKTLLYLSPWILVIAWHWKLFIHQMTTQWGRLAVRNDWLDTPAKAISGLFQSMGSPEPWPLVLHWAAIGLWLLIAAALLFGLILPVVNFFEKKQEKLSLVPSAAWVLGALWLWTSKPEVWFTYFIHAAIWCFVGLAALKAWKAWQTGIASGKTSFVGLISLVALITVIFGTVDLSQAARLGNSHSWHWSTYHDFVDCVDTRLTQYEKNLHARSFSVWCPTFPDITIELSRRHPDWQLTRTNDFASRADLAIQHGNHVDAVVVSETINWLERDIAAPAEAHPEIISTWMTWRQYFLNRLWTEAGWKPNRYVCQKGRWQAFIFMNPE